MTEGSCDDRGQKLRGTRQVRAEDWCSPPLEFEAATSEQRNTVTFDKTESTNPATTTHLYHPICAVFCVFHYTTAVCPRKSFLLNWWRAWMLR